MNKRVNIGTCGFHVTKEKYAELLSSVEVQHTFYQPPQIKTLPALARFDARRI